MSKHWNLHAAFLLAEVLLMILFVVLVPEEGWSHGSNFWSLWRVGIVGVFGVVALVSTLLVAIAQGSGWTKGIHAVLGSLFILVGGAIPAIHVSRTVSQEWRKQEALECFQLRSWDITPPPGRRLRMEAELGYDGVLAFVMLQGQGREHGGYHMTWEPGEAEFQGQAGQLLRMEVPLGEDAPADLSVLSIMLSSSKPECPAIQLDRLTFVPEAVFSGSRRNMTLRLPLPRPSSSS
jgi:hypothetical protein